MRDYVVFSDVSKYYQMGQMVIKAIDHINFSIAKGEFCIIVGPSGAGKTTVLNMLGGMDTCTEGRGRKDGAYCLQKRQCSNLVHSRQNKAVIQ